MKKILKAGATSQTIDIWIGNSSSTTGAGLTGLGNGSAGLTCYYRVGATGNATVLTLANQTAYGAWTQGGFAEISAANMPGLYRLDLANATVASVGSASLSLKGATNMAPVNIELQIVTNDFEAGVVSSVSGAVGSVTGGVGGNITGAVLGGMTGNITGNLSGTVGNVTGSVTVGTNNDKSGYTLSQAFPTNFASLSIAGNGSVVVGSNLDKTGYTLVQNFPTHFANLSLNSAGNVTVQTNNDKTGYSIAGTITSLDTLSSGILSKLLAYFRLMFRKDAATATDQATELTAINADAGSGAGSFDNTTESVQAIRDRGDAAWTTGGGGGGNLTAEDVWTYANRTLTGNVTVDVNNDKTGYELTQAFPDHFANLTLSPTGNVTVGEMADGVISSATFAAGAVDAAALGTDAVNEIQSGLATSTAVAEVKSVVDGTSTTVNTMNNTVNSTLTAVGGVQTDVTGIKAKTDNLPASPASTGDVTGAVAPLATSAELTAANNTINSILEDTAVIGVAGAGLTSIPDSAGATTLLSRLSSTRAGYLDNLNVGGAVASSAEVTSIQNNTRVVRVVPAVIERPDSGTTTYRIELFCYDDAGNMEAPDSTPTLALVDQDGTDLSARLGTATNPATGHYRWIYTASSAHDLEQLLFTFSVTEGGNTRLYGNTAVIVDTTAVDFTSSDRADLQTIKAQTADLQTQVGTDGAGLTNVPWNPAWDAEVESEVTDALNTYDPPTNAEMVARTLAAASYATANGVAAVETDTQDIQSRLPASLVGGRMDAHVGAMGNDTVTALALASDAATEIATAANTTLSAAHGNGTWEGSGGGGGGNATLENQETIIAALSDLTLTIGVDGGNLTAIPQVGNVTGSVAMVTALANNSITSDTLAASAATEIANAANATLSAAHGNGQWGSEAGTGAYSIAVSVTDGTDPLENARVRVTDGVTTHVGVTDEDGLVSFSLDAATYDVAVTKAGYTFAPESRTVTGEQAGTLTDDLEMSLVVAPAEPDNADLCRVSGYVYGVDGVPTAGITLEFVLYTPNGRPAASETLLHGRKVVGATNADGLLTDAEGNEYVDLFRTDTMEPSGCYYRINCSDMNLRNHKLYLTAATYNIRSIVS